MTKQKGWTLAELIIGIAFVCVIGLGAVALYTLGHFIAKFW